LAFLTLVDGMPAILPSLVQHYQVRPAAMGLVLNLRRLGMVVAPWR
jgi:hypothetical protein